MELKLIQLYFYLTHTCPQEKPFRSTLPNVTIPIFYLPIPNSHTNLFRPLQCVISPRSHLQPPLCVGPYTSPKRFLVFLFCLSLAVIYCSSLLVQDNGLVYFPGSSHFALQIHIIPWNWSMYNWSAYKASNIDKASVWRNHPLVSPLSVYSAAYSSHFYI